MKINNFVRLAYLDSEPLYGRLADDVRDRLKAAVEGRKWFFISRVKTLESYAMKIETGRVIDPCSMDDFFACTVVVPTINDIAVAEELVYSHYEKVGRKPPVPDETHKRPSSFEFDDLRLYVKRRPSMGGSFVDLDGLVFEVQIKTVLQYAWGVATHDLIYKTDTVSWTKERIAFQVKAMLEHAELAISEANNLAEAAEFHRQDKRTKEIVEIISVISSVWSDDFLPSDMKRLAENVLAVINLCRLEVSSLKPLLDKEIFRNTILPSDLSPYAFIVQALANSEDVDLRARLKNDKRMKLLMHGGMDVPEWCFYHPQCIVMGKRD